MTTKKFFGAVILIFCLLVGLQNISKVEARAHVYVMTNSKGEEFWIGGGVVQQNYHIPYRNFDFRMLVFSADTGQLLYWLDMTLYEKSGVWCHIINGRDWGVVRPGTEEHAILMFCLSNYR